MDLGTRKKERRRDIRKKKKVLIRRDIPTLTDPSNADSPIGATIPLSATAHFANKNAAIYAVLLLFPNCHLFDPTVSVIHDGSQNSGASTAARCLGVCLFL